MFPYREILKKLNGLTDDAGIIQQTGKAIINNPNASNVADVKIALKLICEEVKADIDAFISELTK